MAPYVNSGPVNTDVDVDTSRVKGQTAIVTGGMVNTPTHRSYLPD